MIVKGQSKKNMNKAVQILLEGGIVVFPTETVYGLGANALDENAVGKIFSIKSRPFEDPLIVHIATPEQLSQIAILPSGLALEMAETLMARFWPGPLTLVFKKKKSLSKLVTGGLDTVAVRIPQNLIALALIRNCDRPLAAPSANKFQSISPTTAEAVEKELGSEVLILDGGPCRVGVESTVLSLESGEPVVLRPGGVSIEKLEYVLGRKVEIKTAGVGEIKLSPGMMDFHYAPKKPLRLFKLKELEFYLSKKKKEIPQTALLCFSGAEQRKFSKTGFLSISVLSPKGRLEEAAHSLFAKLRSLDEGGARGIFVLECPNEDLGLALNDRLKKAEHK